MNSVNTTDNMYNILHIILCHSIPLPIPILTFSYTTEVSHSPVSADDLIEGKFLTLQLHRQDIFSIILPQGNSKGWSGGEGGYLG